MRRASEWSLVNPLLEQLHAFQIPIPVRQIACPATQLRQPQVRPDRVRVHRDGLLSNDEGLLSFTGFREDVGQGQQSLWIPGTSLGQLLISAASLGDVPPGPMQSAEILQNLRRIGRRLVSLQDSVPVVGGGIRVSEHQAELSESRVRRQVRRAEFDDLFQDSSRPLRDDRVFCQPGLLGAHECVGTRGLRFVDRVFRVVDDFECAQTRFRLWLGRARLRESRNAMIGLSRVRHVVRIQPRHVAVSARVVDPWLLSNRERFPAVRFRMTGQAA